MRIYTYKTGSMGEVLKRWGAAIHHREEYSPLAAGMSSELGGLNRWMHVWPYKDLGERDRIRNEALGNPNWAPAYQGVSAKPGEQDHGPGRFLADALGNPGPGASRLTHRMRNRLIPGN